MNEHDDPILSPALVEALNVLRRETPRLPAEQALAVGLDVLSVIGRQLAASAMAARAPISTNGTAPSEQHPLTQAEAAEAYRMPLRLVRRLTRTRCVPSRPQGRNRLILPADLDAYLRRCRELGRKVGTTLDA